MTTFDKLTNSQKIRAALHRDVRAISSETCHFLGLEITKPAMEVIAELVYKKLAVYGTDLEAFAKHAKRASINSEDVKLLARRTPSLLVHLNSLVPSTTSAGPKRRKTGVKPQETPAKNKDNTKEPTNNRGTELQNVEKDKEVIAEDGRKVEEIEEDIIDRMIVDEIDLTFE